MISACPGSVLSTLNYILWAVYLERAVQRESPCLQLTCLLIRNNTDEIIFRNQRNTTACFINPGSELRPEIFAGVGKQIRTWEKLLIYFFFYFYKAERLELNIQPRVGKNYVGNTDFIYWDFIIFLLCSNVFYLLFV